MNFREPAKIGKKIMNNQQKALITHIYTEIPLLGLCLQGSLSPSTNQNTWYGEVIWSDIIFFFYIYKIELVREKTLESQDPQPEQRSDWAASPHHQLQTASRTHTYCLPFEHHRNQSWKQN